MKVEVEERSRLGPDMLREQTQQVVTAKVVQNAGGNKNSRRFLQLKRITDEEFARQVLCLCQSSRFRYQGRIIVSADQLNVSRNGAMRGQPTQYVTCAATDVHHPQARLRVL